MRFAPGAWLWSEEHRQPCQVIEAQSLWGGTVYRVWLPEPDAVVRIPAERLTTLARASSVTAAHLTYLAAAARVADALTQDVLLAPLEASVIPLPHQLRALRRATRGDRVRYLLADEVGLGKTIEAGLVLRELKSRGRVRRTLVIAPKGLVTQWVAEMRTHFNEDFRLLIPGDFATHRRLSSESNLWRTHDQVVCPMDSVKPLESRRGWSRERVARYNHERFEDLIAAGWDLVIVDEAHRLGGSTDAVARFKLGQGLAEAAPYLLLLSATPHQGKTEQFHRLISLLDAEAFPDPESISRERIRPYVIRTEKRQAVDERGEPLFRPRETRTVAVAWDARHREQALLYEAVTEYARQGYNQAIRDRKPHVGFLMLLFQRLVTSSTRAIRTALQRRLEVLHEPEEQLSLIAELSAEDLEEMGGEEQAEVMLARRWDALQNEQHEVSALLELARRTEATGPDAKAGALLEWILRLQREEADPNLKLLIFTEFVPTQQMLGELLEARGISVVSLNGSIDLDERRVVQREFAGPARVLVSTDAGGEGLNLQFCHVAINYDIPWNPMKLEQRIGRVDRIGQTHPVRAFNFALEDSVEGHVREVLERKLSVILREFGVDKTGDVLDSAVAGQVFESLYAESLLHPDQVEASVDRALGQVREEVSAARGAAALLGSDEVPDAAEAERIRNHPLPHWVERMTVSYLEANGGRAEKSDRGWTLEWPGGERLGEVTFVPDADAEADRLLTLEDPRIRALATRLSRFAAGQPIARVRLPDLPGNVVGYWSLWRIVLHTASGTRQRMLPLFLHVNGRVFLPTAHHLWNALLEGSAEVAGALPPEETAAVIDRLQRAASEHGRDLYDTLRREHTEQLDRDEDKYEFAFAARRRALQRIGLPAVRAHRLRQLEDEERAWRREHAASRKAVPELYPVIVVRIGPGDP
ncbi:MAG: DEAD/DEAH box helicase family protein [Gemmatimonadetes bacterium]|nr:DEAD/DEAH box helicase family protein [Gemmatimonadota bacterium]MBA4157045.1 DEAD/DEAH box helicase family protein [Gemmatimonadota bacterium]